MLPTTKVYFDFFCPPGYTLVHLLIIISAYNTDMSI